MQAINNILSPLTSPHKGDNEEEGSLLIEKKRTKEEFSFSPVILPGCCTCYFLVELSKTVTQLNSF